MQPLRSLPEMAPCVLQGLAHGRGTSRTHARKGLFTHRRALSEVGRASHTAGIRGVTPVVGAGTPSLVQHQLSEENRAGTALGATVGLQTLPGTSCPHPQVAPSSAPQVTVPSWPSPGSAHITYTCTSASVRAF